VWEQKDVSAFNNMLADNFTFSSAAGDDHISKSAFKTQCWDTQINFIAHFDLERITTGPSDAFVKYLCHTKNGKSFRNVEYLRIRNGKLESIECYFGAQSSFPSAVSNG
jgi:ketosteroid isomerase-like protein